MNALMEINSYRNALRSNEMQQSMIAQQGFPSAADDASLRTLKEDSAGLKKAAEAFEGIFINLLFQSMRKTVNQEEGYLPPSNTQTIFQEMWDQEISNELSKKGSFGIADAVVKTYGKTIEAKADTAALKQSTINQMA